MQGLALRTWPADAVHDTVAAVLRTPPFQRDLRTTLLARLLRWLGDAVVWLAGALHGMPGGRSAVIWVTALVCALVVARVLFAARARDPDAAGGRVARSIGRARDPWRTAEALAASGDHEGAAHALYRAAP